ncbi:MAG: 1-(5-phosphoribosyl)-5-[(5-phosphoribosylamino)methylideneamino] imidazole-4-carboxamide isomerase, partial [Parvularcula sp.]|nr:1-(5-phosphoribosyl)-5-[(5-phosphoribosylamino)methylideneamino] imidazole-4-carboxamide isomerase [Parvularcula sp.]
SSKTYNQDPADQARNFLAAGFTNLHVVDLDGAFAGAPANADAVRRIIAATDATIQLGGGIRSRTVAERWLDLGVGRVILGTIAMREPDFALSLAKSHRGRVVIGIDAKDGMVATEGWASASETAAIDLARQFDHAAVAAIVYTDIGKDGALQGPNIDATLELAEAVSVPIIASGGVSSADDIAALARVSEKGIAGVIVGKALYEGRVSPADALKAAQG